MEEKELFVPGRISLLGGITDLVSKYLPQNEELIPGNAISVTLDKGIYAKVKRAEHLSYQFDEKKFICEIDENKLKEIAQSNSFYSYISGTMLYMIKQYDVSGIDITIQKMDLPMKKGLASSAAICLVVVKGLNELYDLNLSPNEMVKCAYEGEHLALSECGMLDQATIINNGISKLTFKTGEVEMEKIEVKNPVYFVVTDLKASKDTKKIMKDFNSCFPFVKDEKQKKVHDLMGVKNKNLVKEAKEAIEMGDNARLGNVFCKWQNLIDQTDVVCDEMKAPVLHNVLEDENVKELTFGGKGTGSGGDGSAIFIAKNKESQDELIEYLNVEKNMEAFAFCLNPMKNEE